MTDITPAESVAYTVMDRLPDEQRDALMAYLERADVPRDQGLTVERIASHRYIPAIERAMKLIPSAIHPRIHCDFLCGVDPVFVGLHSFKDASFGRSYRNTAHCAYPGHQLTLPKSRRRTTIVIPNVETPETVVHELGHVLHESLRFEPVAAPLNWYAATNDMEAFAEAFTAWVIPGYWSTQGRQDEATNGLLNALAA